MSKRQGTLSLFLRAVPQNTKGSRHHMMAVACLGTVNRPLPSGVHTGPASRPLHGPQAVLFFILQARGPPRPASRVPTTGIMIISHLTFRTCPPAGILRPRRRPMGSSGRPGRARAGRILRRVLTARSPASLRASDGAGSLTSLRLPVSGRRRCAARRLLASAPARPPGQQTTTIPRAPGGQGRRTARRCGAGCVWSPSQ